MVISEDILYSRAAVQPSNIKDGHLTGFSDETLANIFAVSSKLCGSKFELKLNDVRFVGHPVSLEPDASVEKVTRRTTLTMFHIVFALRAVGNYSIIPCYHELSQRLGLILRHEEERVGYLTQQMRCLLDAQDEVGRLPEEDQGGQLAGHLLYWGKATVIYPLCESNLYVLSPHLPTPLPLRLSNRFCERFGGDSLLDHLSAFSLPCRLALSPPLALHQPRQLEVIVWLLQHHLVIQLHTYVSLALDDHLSFTYRQERPPPAPPAPP